MGESLLSRIADEVGTPVYVYDAAVIAERYRALCDALAPWEPYRIHYSVKANGNLAVLRLLKELGAGADIVSGGELARVVAAGFDPADVVFSGAGKTRTELEGAVRHGVGLINVESAAEAESLAAVVGDATAGKPVAVGIRVNPDITTETHPYTQTGAKGMKFGVPLDEVERVSDMIADQTGLTLASIGMHIGSQLADAAPYVTGARTLVDLVGRLRKRGVTTLTSLDVGGGLGIQYRPGRPALEPRAFADAVGPAARETGLTLVTEPGRYLVGPAGHLVTRVVYRKHAGGRELAIVDAGMNDLVRPALYQAWHEVAVLRSGAPAPNGTAVDVVGPICESGDFLGLERTLPEAGSGALLVIHGVGAYGFTMASNYNARPRAAEVLMDGDRYAVVRARERIEDLMRGETAEPEWHA